MSNSNTTRPTVLFFSRDIFFAPSVKTAALAAECDFQIVGQVSALPQLESSQVRACVVDLTPLSLEQVAELGQLLSQHYPSSRKIAFGPHVQVDHFAAAARAGFDPVLAKGQVAMMLGRYLS